MTDNENALIAYAILDEVNGNIGNVTHDVLMRDIARAQVYATLATVPTKPSAETIAETISGVMADAGWLPEAKDVDEAAEAVWRLL